MADTNVTTNSEQKKWPVWLVASLGFLTIICGIITICAPSVFWKFLDIILGIFLIFSGISAIIKWFADKEKHLWLLIILASLIILLWFLLVFSGSKFIWTLTIWSFAIWALLRWFILVYFSLTNREQQRFWWGILALWVLLIILSIVIAFSDKSEARALAWICIWISTVFDWIFLLILSFRVNDDPSLQSQVLEQANQNEIAQWSITTSNAQPVVATPDAQPVVAIPDAQPVVATPDAQPVVATPDAKPVVTTPDTQPVVATPDAQPVVATPDAQPVVATPDAQPVVATPDAQPEANQQSDNEVKPWDIQEPIQEDSKVQW